MNTRALQPKLSEEEAERLEEEQNDPLKPSTFKYPLPVTLEHEHRFPVLLISCQGPQHARILYSCMGGDTLVIRQSKLYSFEKQITAPWDLFTRWMLSHPKKETYGQVDKTGIYSKRLSNV
ncbi:hypothetical protein FE257_004487 [Aspergillus nanangensis]|uniref:Uncharacterized protein n=1 Tax=Aspergillus nanangensis TaxID=2582783 RepID=A0AAD4GZE1_ASPNN|nr:hypothetical protein FE257_004487 [Aspergillus nanangensis]